MLSDHTYLKIFSRLSGMEGAIIYSYLEFFLLNLTTKSARKYYNGKI